MGIVESPFIFSVEDVAPGAVVVPVDGIAAAAVMDAGESALLDDGCCCCCCC